ncbi:MAG: hypothetical protein GX100_11580 [candidate division WS1 bacterium]|jgi:hypothetical protein|nr:hypothetical protein [candidate division WS1 bacterium]
MTQRSRLTIWALAAFLLVTALLWRQVFVMTGILWWQAPQPAERPLPPPPAVFAPADTDWVDLEIYLRNHPVWPIHW